MKLRFRLYVVPLTLLALAGCASQGKPPPSISLDETVLAQPLPEPPSPSKSSPSLNRWRCRRS